MTGKSSYLLHSVSVFVTAEYHNPSIVNPSFLSSEGIVPEELDVAETISTPPLSLVRYANGIQWLVDQSTLNVAKDCEASFRDEYQVHSLAAKYVEKLPHVPYRSLGLNFVVSANVENPRQWLTAAS